MSIGNSIKVAVVGAGPSGFYAAQALAAAHTDIEIDLIDRLPTPYGLIRSGVAPDHPNTKAIQGTFEQVASDSRVCFFGNVTVGRDIRLDELRGMYDAVVLASGAPLDLRLGIPGEDMDGVYGAAEFVGWYNGHPDYADLAPPLDKSGAVVIGNGNVAIDIARILSKPLDELGPTDIADHAIERLAGSAIREIHIVGRRGPADSKFTNVELRELGEMANAVAIANGDDLPDAAPEGLAPRERRMKEKNLQCFHAFAEADPLSKPRRIRFSFFARPDRILGKGRVTAVRFEGTQLDEKGHLVGRGEYFEIPCGLVVTAIGYSAEPIDGLTPEDMARLSGDPSGRIERGFYLVGWLKRGPSGKIATNRADGDELAKRLLAEISPAGRPGRAGLRQRLDSNGTQWVDFDQWKLIEAEEFRTARAGAPRRKITKVADMLALCRPR